ncbi:NAD(P)/FAD-dependent oxidoreductase [Candidatus Saccharibacteria bacterium]|nr:NAD(P)/FAD-dependent oxidoreductase [Candidatus Saccharibacteria bacterium]
MSKSKSQKVVIIGSGFGGTKAALEIANKPGFDVTLISKTTNFDYHGALYRTATGNSPSEVVIPLREIFDRAKNVEVVLDEIERLNPEAKSVKSASGRRYEYDRLILALGNQINYFGLDGMEDKTFCINTIKHTIALRHELISRFKSRKEVIIAVIGGGPSGVELAGELDNFAKKVTSRHNKKYVQPKVILIEGADRLLPIFDPVLSAKVYKRLKALGVDIKLSTKVNSCEQGKVCLDTGDIDADIIVWTAGSKIPEFYENNKEAFMLERGRIKVNNHLQTVGHSNIYVIGDNAATKYTGMAQTALYDAVFVANNLVREHKGKKLKSYEPKRPIYAVPVGPKWAVLQTDKSQLSGARAWLLRRRADLDIFKNFEPYKRAVKRWRKGNNSAQY